LGTTNKYCIILKLNPPHYIRIPIKAAGDVSLSGGQLTAFLTKATLLLPQVPMLAQFAYSVTYSN
jgi:hypothetical protein